MGIEKERGYFTLPGIFYKRVGKRWYRFILWLHSWIQWKVIPTAAMGAVRVVELMNAADATIAEAGAKALRGIALPFS